MVIACALRAMGEARPGTGDGPAARAQADADRAEALRQAGHLYEAESLLADAAAVFDAEGMPRAHAEAELRRARSLLSHDLEGAERAAAVAETLLRSVGSVARALVAESVGLRARLAAGNRSAVRRAARAHIVTIAERMRVNGFAADARALELTAAGAYARAGRPPDRLPPLVISDPLEVRLLAHEARAAQAAARADDEAALRHAAEGLAEFASWQRAHGPLGTRSAIAMFCSGLLCEGISAAVRSGRPDLVFEWSERSRHFTQQIAPLRPPPDPEHARDLARLRGLRAQSPAAACPEDRVREIQRRITDRQRGMPSVTGPPRLTLDGFREQLEQGTVLLSFVFTSTRLVCLVVPARGEPRVVPLRWAAIEPLIEGMRRELDAVAHTGGTSGAFVRAALERHLAELSRLLVEPALAVAGLVARVVVTATGVLRVVPWSMLPPFADVPVSFARSASGWAYAHRRPRVLERAGFVVGPGVSRGMEEAEIGAAVWAAEASQRGRVDPLPRVLTGEQATTDAVLALAGEVDVLHIVAHGHHAALAPMFSGVNLVDGTLFAYDIDQIEEPPALVVLSACEGGRSSGRWGEESLGMALAWLRAGSRCVIATPVVVADGVACEVLGAMHEGLAARLGPAEALTLAMRQTGHLVPFIAYGTGF